MALAIITGASSGIGAEFARQLKKCGVSDFWFIARRGDKMRALGEELGVSCKIIEADLATSEGIELVTSALEKEKPEVDYLLNCAGFGTFGAADEIGVDTIEKMIDLNVKASVLLTHIIVPYMKRGSRIVMMGSGSCFTPLPYFNAYSSGKVFILHYTKSLNYELKKYGIRATCFCPGWVETEFLGKAAGEKETTRPRPSAIKPLLNCEKVVRGCMKAVKRGRAMYVTGWYTKLQHVLFKLLPDCILTRLWLGMLERGDGDKAE